MSFISKVNEINLVTTGGKLCIRKTFSTEGLKTGVHLPLSRSDVEFRILANLSKLLPMRKYGVETPKVVRFIDHPRAIEMEYIPASNLRQISGDELPNAQMFYQLGRFLKIIQDLSTSKTTRLFEGLEESSRISNSAMLQYKIPFYVPIEHESLRPTLCLGDLTLANILASKSTIYLIDFEFAHIGHIGFDIGQLLAELDSGSVGVERPDIALALREGFSIENEFFGQCEYWVRLFSPYFKLRN